GTKSTTSVPVESNEKNPFAAVERPLLTRCSRNRLRDYAEGEEDRLPLCPWSGPPRIRGILHGNNWVIHAFRRFARQLELVVLVYPCESPADQEPQRGHDPDRPPQPPSVPEAVEPIVELLEQDI